MRPALGILCYHRIVRDDDDRSWPYLERGTAVRARVFEQQLADIARFAAVVSEAVALDILAGRRPVERPSVWLTFDDGYRDVIDILPFVETATAFVTTGTATRLLPADAWYSVILAANRTRGVIDLGLGRFDFDLSNALGRARLVHGPERRAFLRADETAQAATLEELARQVDATATMDGLYLSESELHSMVRLGWSIGSHGVSHAPFDSLEPEPVRQEAATSRDVLRSFGSVRSIALPDGARGHASVLREVGYECVLGLGDGPCAIGLEVQPRFLMPDDPAWVTRVLEPVLTRAADA
ncbi:MAG TPA: polysaccharide deacetylase family protein [Kofleriaceae bacterium]|jgi:peptidoglycan/xylan/chitin deacetylase (PgdA/CDA1 family)